MYQAGDTIKNTLDQIDRRDLILPAIQREFIWDHERVCKFFDSLMQGYPFGTFLYWRVDPENSARFKFFEFMLNYHERDNYHCQELSQIVSRRVAAVLDGQQRLTALNIGLKGSMAWRLPRRWRNNPDAFPSRRLYLDVLWQADPDDEDGLQYRFAFLTDEQLKQRRDDECWYLVPDVLLLPVDAAGAVTAINEWLVERLPEQPPKEQWTHAVETLFTLHQVVHARPLVVCYEESGQELDRALQIFIRMNDGGIPLSHSDLLLSIAVAQWTPPHDARQEINDLVDGLNRIGTEFSFSKDLVLKAGLMLSDIGSVGFKVNNFNRANMETFEGNWENIKQALTLTVQLVSSFGFNGQNLTAHNAILPIAYYLYKRDPGESFLTHNSFSEDRANIREWLVRSLLKSGVWGSGLDTLLTELRRVIRDDWSSAFPAAEISETMARRGRELTFNDEEIEDLADMGYSNRLTFALLSMLFPFVDLRNQFHVDHIFPAARFTERRLRSAGVPDDKIEDFIKHRDGLANLQLLQGAMNVEKNAKMPVDWLSETFPDNSRKDAYTNEHLLDTVPDSITEFDTFYDERRQRLKQRISELLGRQNQP